MTNKANCVFCKIVAWETPSQRVYEDEEYIAFLDINPINFGHTLIIPREHYPSLHETPDKVLAGMMRIAKKISPAVVRAMKADGYNLGVNTGTAAGQAVDHVHFHVIPRFSDDGFRAWAGRNKYGEGEMGATARKIKESLEES